jgi:hypothetical protein
MRPEKPPDILSAVVTPPTNTGRFRRLHATSRDVTRVPVQVEAVEPAEEFLRWHTQEKRSVRAQHPRRFCQSLLFEDSLRELIQQDHGVKASVRERPMDHRRPERNPRGLREWACVELVSIDAVANAHQSPDLDVVAPNQQNSRSAGSGWPRQLLTERKAWNSYRLSSNFHDLRWRHRVR